MWPHNTPIPDQKAVDTYKRNSWENFEKLQSHVAREMELLNKNIERHLKETQDVLDNLRRIAEGKESI